MRGIAVQTRPSLLARVRDVRDADAWQTFVTLYAPLVYRYVRQRGLQDADAADLTQDVMSAVARSIRTFEYRPERGRFRDWLRTIAHGSWAGSCEGDPVDPRRRGTSRGWRTSKRPMIGAMPSGMIRSTPGSSSRHSVASGPASSR